MCRVQPVSRVIGVTVLACAAMALNSAQALADGGPVKPTPTPRPTAVTQSITPQEYAQAQAIAQATSLSVRIDAERALAASERAFLDQRIVQVRAEREQIIARIVALQAEAAQRQAELDRLVQQQYRASQHTPLEVLIATGSVLSAIQATDALGSLADAQHAALVELQRVQADLESQRADLAAHEADLLSMNGSLAAKDAQLAKLAAQADRLAAGGSAAEIGVLADLVETELAATAKVDQLIAAAAAAAGAPAFQQALRWVWPSQGPVSQPFGPTALTLEPPRTYHGVAYPNFHDGIDIAAPLGAPVFAAAGGRVAFVGHLPDGAEIVLIAHDGGLFSMYAHLDDTHAPPPVKVGDSVRAGDPIGWIGLTGITTGPHLHFVIRRGDEPIDPSGLLPHS
jgi:murein DD-endopeptidase MepM/ murein hydrolase activator NlpD